jgi:hypothetical protein
MHTTRVIQQFQFVDYTTVLALQFGLEYALADQLRAAHQLRQRDNISGMAQFMRLIMITR